MPFYRCCGEFCQFHLANKPRTTTYKAVVCFLSAQPTAERPPPIGPCQAETDSCLYDIMCAMPQTCMHKGGAWTWWKGLH